MRFETVRKEYRYGELDPNLLPADPVKGIGLWVQQAVEAEVVDATAFALATVDVAGAPDVRYVLLKRVENSYLAFATSYQSVKAMQIYSNPRIAGAFYWRELERQLRFRGTVSKAPQEVSDQIFNARPLGARLSATISHQSAPIASRAALLEAWQTASSELQEPLQRPEEWGAYIIEIEEVEFWQGRENRLHDRFRYTKGPSGWTVERLQP
ncbi:MAG: pyridoxamine 5'-phosphate oxidase [Fimbriimonadaceae bacterium]